MPMPIWEPKSIKERPIKEVQDVLRGICVTGRPARRLGSSRKPAGLVETPSDQCSSLKTQFTMGDAHGRPRPDRNPGSLRSANIRDRSAALIVDCCQIVIQRPAGAQSDDIFS